MYIPQRISPSDKRIVVCTTHRHFLNGAYSPCSTEMDKSYDTFMASARHNNTVNSTKSYSSSPRHSHHGAPHSGHSNAGNNISKLPPTGPRSYKKPRLSETQASPPSRSDLPLPSRKSQGHPHISSRGDLRDGRGGREGRDGRDIIPRHAADTRGKFNHIKMEVDEDKRVRPASPGQRERDRDRERDNDRERWTRESGMRERERDKEHDRDGNRAPRRNGSHVGPVQGVNSARKTERAISSNAHLNSGDRTLAERMGL